MQDREIGYLLNQVNSDTGLVEEISSGEVVDTVQIEYDGEDAIFQAAVNNRQDSSHRFLMTGGRILEQLDAEFTPNILEKNYDDDSAWHVMEKIEGNPPKRDEDWREIGKVLSNLHEIDLEFDYGKLWGTTQDLDLQDSNTDWNVFLDERFKRYGFKSATSEELHESTDHLRDIWDNDFENRPERAILHNDIKPDNVIYSDNGPVLIDLDQAIHGDPDLEFYRVIEALKLRSIDPVYFEQGYQESRDRDIDTSLEETYTAYALMKEVYGQTSKTAAGIPTDSELIESLKRRIEDFSRNTSP